MARVTRGRQVTEGMVRAGLPSSKAKVLNREDRKGFAKFAKEAFLYDLRDNLAYFAFLRAFDISSGMSSGMLRDEFLPDLLPLRNAYL
jgi:hypothetical protein